MKEAIPKRPHGGARPGSGRPATGKDPVLTARVPRGLIDQLEEWARDSGMTRSEALRLFIENGLKKPRRLLEIGLKAKGK
jgi:Ribbon-helix-helix protein, copG family